MDLVEIKMPQSKGKAVVKNHAQYDQNGKVLMPIKKGKKTSLGTIEAVKEILAKKENLKTEKKAPKINVEKLIEEFKGTFVADTDRAGFVNFRYPGSKKLFSTQQTGRMVLRFQLVMTIQNQAGEPTE